MMLEVRQNVISSPKETATLLYCDWVLSPGKMPREVATMLGVGLPTESRTVQQLGSGTAPKPLYGSLRNTVRLQGTVTKHRTTPQRQQPHALNLNHEE